MKTLLETLQSGTAYLEKRGVDEPRLNMEHLTAKVLDCTRMDLYLAFDRPLEERHLAPLRDMTKRRGDREPLQHILGNVDFMGKEFLSDKRALIPRPETELVIDIVCEIFKENSKRLLFAELGTGSGAISIALAIKKPLWSGIASDIDQNALNIASRNFINSTDQSNLKFICGHWWRPFKTLKEKL